MSKVTKRKHVMKEIQADDFDPPGPNQQIVRILGSRGNNLHEVESAEPIAGNGNESTDATATTATNDGMPDTSREQFLVSMPTKYRKNVWVKRGDFVIVEPIDEGDKVKAEIVRILTPQHIKEFTKDGIWPEKFTTKNNNETKNYYADDDSSDNDDELFKNTNRAHQYIDSEEEDESDDDEESEDGDESDGNESDGEESSSDKGN
ncbi:probable RNA-binding protein EIF1AD [Contarinia nasturtii]|uniref:probable RNA-binding protein EIF1AD n=1 Tax=Contarinia nasturtii TaxID=265458 RepID=UPI0012D41F1B|nr:probable RNA-binding protein EIF1AD [Contarinia nasturtii]